MSKDQQARHLIQDLLATDGIDLMNIQDNYPELRIRTPWDLFRFCRLNQIWLMVNDELNDQHGNFYYGTRLREIEEVVQDKSKTSA
jgi:hypothetical protein